MVQTCTTPYMNRTIIYHMPIQVPTFGCVRGYLTHYTSEATTGIVVLVIVNLVVVLVN